MARTTIQKRIKRIVRSPRLLLITGTLLVLGATLLFANKGIWRHIALKHEVSERHEHLAVLTGEERELTGRVNLLRLEDAAMLERIARERYSMKRAGEIIYRTEGRN